MSRPASFRSIAWRLTIGVVLSWLTVAGIEAGLAYHEVRPWGHAPYLRGLLSFAAALTWASVLLRHEITLLAETLKGRPLFLPLIGVAAFMLTSVLLVSGADLALLWLGRVTSPPWRGVPLAPWAWTSNVALLFMLYLSAFALTARIATAILIVTPAYVALTAATMAKLTYMHTAVQPLDLLRLPEFLPLFPEFFGGAVLAAAVAAALIWGLALAAVYRAERAILSWPLRVCVALASLVALAAVPLAFSAAEKSPQLKARLLRLGAPDGQFKEQAKRNGILLSFASELPSFFAIRVPSNYGALAARQVGAKYADPRAATPTAPPHVNLIVYLVESLMDPHDLGVRYTSEPVPNIRALRDGHIGGYVIVPGLFGGSANTEFEILTGMSMAFLPEESLPYRQYLRHPIPSLPWQLKRLGYATTAVQPDPKFYYDRERAYDLLGFDKVVWLDEVPNIERDGRVGWPTDRAVVQAVIQAGRTQEAVLRVRISIVDACVLSLGFVQQLQPRACFTAARRHSSRGEGVCQRPSHR